MRFADLISALTTAPLPAGPPTPVRAAPVAAWPQPPRSVAEVRRALVVADDAWPGAPSLMRLAGKDVLVIAPALASRPQEWASDLDPGIRAAQGRLDGWLAGLAELGICAHGRVGDADPRWAIADALSEFDAEEIIIATPSADRAHHREPQLPADTRRRYRLPTMHLTPDPSQPHAQALFAA